MLLGAPVLGEEAEVQKHRSQWTLQLHEISLLWDLGTPSCRPRGFLTKVMSDLTLGGQPSRS